MTIQRIYFLDNPYPNGHQIKEFVWSGRLDESEKLWFDFHLETDDYYAEDETGDLDEPESDWKAKSVWGNYHNCTISSTYWGELGGIRIDNSVNKFHFDNLLQTELSVDTLPIEDNFDYEGLAFHIYLLGHDSCADHKLKFSKNENYDIEWTGKIALTYGGDYEFKYEFIGIIQNIKFDGFHFPNTWTIEKAKEIFDSKLSNFEEFEFVDLNPKSNKREFKLAQRR